MANKIKFMNRFSATGEKKKHGTVIKGESLTNISRQEDTDIKIMCAKYGLTSVLQKCQVTEPMYGYDLTETTDINQRLEVRERMKQYFYEQPPKIRKEFGDDFTRFYEMYMTGDTAKMKYLGIIKEETNEKIHNKNFITNNTGTMESNNATSTTSDEGTNN